MALVIPVSYQWYVLIKDSNKFDYACNILKNQIQLKKQKANKVTAGVSSGG